MNRIVLSAAAAREVRRLLQIAWERAGSEGARPARIGLAVRAGGCNGSYYDLSAAGAIAPGDRTFESRGIAIAVDPESFACLAGVSLTIDYTEDLVGGAFRFEAAGDRKRLHCDCGLSFRLPNDPGAV